MGGQPPVFLLGPQHGAELRRGVAAAAALPVLPLLRRKEATIDRCVASPGDRRFPVNNRKIQERGGTALGRIPLLREPATRRPHRSPLDIGNPGVFRRCYIISKKVLVKSLF